MRRIRFLIVQQSRAYCDSAANQASVRRFATIQKGVGLDCTYCPVMLAHGAAVPYILLRLLQVQLRAWEASGAGLW